MAGSDSTDGAGGLCARVHWPHISLCTLRAQILQQVSSVCYCRFAVPRRSVCSRWLLKVCMILERTIGYSIEHYFLS